MQSRRIVTCVILVLILVSAVGCQQRRGEPVTTPANPPEVTETAPVPGKAEMPGTPEASGTAEVPAITSIQVLLGESYKNWGAVIGTLVVEGSGKVVVGTEGFGVHVRLQPAPPKDWYRQHVKVEGAAPRQSGDPLQGEVLGLSFGRGYPDQTIRITIGGVIPPDGNGRSLVLNLRRKEEPRAVLEVEEEGAWRPVAPDEVLPRRPLALRLRFTKDMDRRSVEESLASRGPVPGRLSWVDGRTLLWQVDQPPPVLRPTLLNARDTDGLWLIGQVPVAHTGEPPALYRVDPATGRETRLCSLVPEIREASLSPDGTTLFAQAYYLMLGRYPNVEDRSWAIDVSTGKRDQVGNGLYLGWVGGDALLRVAGGKYEMVNRSGSIARSGTLPLELRFMMPSPDGTLLAGLLGAPIDYRTEATRDFVSHDLVIIDLERKAARTVKDFVKVFLPPVGGWETPARPAWSPDGRQIAALSDLPGGGAQVVVADLSSGETSAAVTLPGLSYGTIHPFSWSPDGKWWLAGNRLISINPPHEVTKIQIPDRGRHWWSPDGEWLTASYPEWKRTVLYHIPTLRSLEMGDSFPVGWDKEGLAYVIRWEGAQERYVPEYP